MRYTDLIYESYYSLRAPLAGSTSRNRWNDALREHQPNIVHRNTFNICIRHFSSNDLLENSSAVKLHINATPSIFATSHSQDIPEMPTGAECSSCVNLQQEIAKLQNDIILMSASHDIKLQSEKQKMLSVRGELKEKKKEIQAMSTKINQLAKDNHILKQLSVGSNASDSKVLLFKIVSPIHKNCQLALTRVINN